MTSAPPKQQLLQDLMQNIEARKQTEQRLKATMGVLLARSENQILVLETLLKRLVQVCVHTQDKRLAKELKLMDFTRLAKKIGDEHTHMRQMLIHEDGMLGPSPAESFLMEPTHSNGVNGNSMGMQNQRMDEAQMPGGAGMNYSQYRTQSQPSGNQHVPQHPMQQQMMQHQQQQKPQATGPQTQHMPHMPHSQGPSINQASTSNGPQMRRDAGAGMVQGRDNHMQLRNLWPQDGPNLDNSNGMGGMPNGGPNLQGIHSNHF